MRGIFSLSNYVFPDDWKNKKGEKMKDGKGLEFESINEKHKHSTMTAGLRLKRPFDDPLRDEG